VEGASETHPGSAGTLTSFTAATRVVCRPCGVDELHDLCIIRVTRRVADGSHHFGECGFFGFTLEGQPIIWRAR